jgi:hypothetical protein
VKNYSAWDRNQVYSWAIKDLNLDGEDAQKLWTQKITGSSLLKYTVDTLMADGLPRGPATDLADAIAALKGSATAAMDIGPQVGRVFSFIVFIYLFIIICTEL